MKTKAAVLRGVDERLDVAEAELAPPGVVVAPPMLSVNKAAIDGGTYGNLTWDAARAGVARELT